ncbi:MAG: type II toxin-antitoxin system HicA family toxin [Schwartzia sp.]|nr:type II toxin-antitoxin system HicA family toxin [Schwartzia sp. (in: firmicutes)]
MTPKEIEKIIRKDGWYLVQVEGAHHQYKHPTKSGKVTIAFHSKPKDLKPRTVKSILKQAGLK